MAGFFTGLGFGAGLGTGLGFSTTGGGGEGDGVGGSGISEKIQMTVSFHDLNSSKEKPNVCLIDHVHFWSY